MDGGLKKVEEAVRSQNCGGGAGCGGGAVVFLDGSGRPMMRQWAKMSVWVSNLWSKSHQEGQVEATT